MSQLRCNNQSWRSQYSHECCVSVNDRRYELKFKKSIMLCVLCDMNISSTHNGPAVKGFSTPYTTHWDTKIRHKWSTLAIVMKLLHHKETTLALGKMESMSRTAEWICSAHGMKASCRPSWAEISNSWIFLVMTSVFFTTWYPNTSQFYIQLAYSYTFVSCPDITNRQNK